MTVPSQVTYMTCYDYLRGFFLSLERQAPSESLSTSASPTSPSLQIITAHSLLSSLMAGALARAVSATLVTPLELVRTRLQASSAGSSSFSSILASLRADMRSQGPRVLWRGLSPTLWRDVPFSAIYFAGYEGMKRSLTGGGLGEGNASGGAEEFGIAFLSGAVSGSVAAVLTQPFDLIKTRLQAPSPPASSSSSPSSSRSSPSRPGRPSPASSASTSTRLLSVVAQIVRDEGAAGLFRGLSPRVAKVAPACGVMIASFEVVGRALAEAE